MKTSDYESLSPRVRLFLRAADALGRVAVSFFNPQITQIAQIEEDEEKKTEREEKKESVKSLPADLSAAASAKAEASAQAGAQSAVKTPAGVRKILLARCDGIGDLVLSTPAIRALRARFPDAAIHLMVGPWAKDIAEMVPGVDKVIPHAPWGYRALRASRGNLSPMGDLRMAARIRRERYDLAVDLRGDLLTLLPMVFWKIPERVGRATRGGGFALTRVVPPARPGGEHEVDRTLAVVAALGAGTDDRAIELNVPGDALLGARAFLERQGLDPEKSFVFGPGAQWPWKLWPRRNFAELGRTLVADGYRVVVVGAGREAMMIEEIVRAGGPGMVGCAGALDLRELAGLFLLCRGYVAVDSGLGHIAAAAGAPGVMLFGPGPPAQFAPVSEKVRVLRKPCPLHPCHQRGPCRRPDHWCMRRIAPGEVYEALRSVIR